MSDRSDAAEPDAGAAAWTVDGEYALLGRTFEEYVHLFDLDPEALVGRRILDCPSGPASFVAEASRRGIDAVGADVAYRAPPGALARRCRRDFEDAAAQHRAKRGLFTWEFYGDVDTKDRYQRAAYEQFLADYGRAEAADPPGADARPGSSDYVAAALPELPFADDAFDLALSGHFLFLYGDRLSVRFHREALRELVRVASEAVRVYPLTGLDTERYDHLEAVAATVRSAGHRVEVRPVPFEFQRGADEMLVVDVR
jgi:SAM-dependent methyltransferase